MDVQCAYTIVWMPFEGSNIQVYTCSINNTRLDYTTINPVGVNAFGNKAADVTRVVIQHSKIVKFPSLQLKFPYLRILCLNNCGLLEVPCLDKQLKSELTELNLDNNKLYKLKITFKNEFSQLKVLSARNNQIESIEFPLLNVPNIYENITLESLNVQQNVKYDCVFEKQKDEHGKSFAKRILLGNDKQIKAAPQAPSKDNVVDRLQHLTSGISTLLENGMLSDFIIKTSARDFRVHKNVLASYSSVFKAMFTLEKVVKRQHLFISSDDFSEAIIEEFLTFIYTGVVPARSSNLVDLYSIAAIYDIEMLKEVCGQKILKDVIEKNPLDVLTIGNLYGNKQMKEEAFAKIKKILNEPNLKDELMNNPKEVKNLFDAKRSYADILKTINAKLNMF